MRYLIEKLIFGPIGLIVLLILGLVVFLFLSKKKQEDIAMTGQHHYSNNPNAPKDIESLDLTYFSLYSIGTSFQENDFVYGASLLEITLSIYDENDEYILKKAKDKLKEFQQYGYMLWLTVSNKTSEDYVSFNIPVNKEFVEKFALLVRQSDIMTLNGRVDWTDGIPEDAGQFILAARYQTKEKLSISINGKAPSNQEKNLFKKLKPLFIKIMLENNADYIPLLNYDRIIINPQELISSINISQEHVTLLNTFNFNLEINDKVAYLSGKFTDYDNTFSCETAEIEQSDLEILLNGLINNRYVLVTDSFEHKNNVEILEDGIFSFYIHFNVIDEGFKPYYGSFDENTPDVIYIFKQLVKKYRGK